MQIQEIKNNKIHKTKVHLQNDYDRLNKICAALDPYQELTDKQKENLAQFEIRCWENPFQLTNEILTKLLEIEEQLRHE